jgi:hypothetical protein
MEDPGQRLKKRREELDLRYRDVEELSQQIAARHRNDEFAIALSRLADIENRGTVPSLYRLYSLCAIYRLDILDVLEWYGVNVSQMPADAAQMEISATHLLGFRTVGHGSVQMPISLDPGIDIRRTTYLSRMVQRWGRLPLMLLDGLDLKTHRYGYVGTEDWSMYPLIQPGSLVLIDETRRKISNTGWSNEFERPIYLLEHRGGYIIGWCTDAGSRIVLQPHPASECNPTFFGENEVDVIGQVVGVAMRLDPARRRRTRA